MSTTLLQELHQEVRRLYVAGSDLAIDDFRLKRMQPQLAQLGERSPVFKRINALTEAVTQPEDRQQPGASAERLQDLGTLLQAILYTQGNGQVEEERLPLEPQPQVRTTTHSYRQLAAVREALSTTSGGRHEVVVHAFERGLFQDFRLTELAIDALGDPYSVIADYMEHHVLPTMGRGLLPLLSKRLDLKGGREDARRLNVMLAIDRQAHESLMLEAAHSGNGELQVAAIGWMKGQSQYEQALIDWTKSRKKSVREAAFQSLAPLQSEAVQACIYEALDGRDSELAAEAAMANQAPALMQRLLEDLATCSNRLVADAALDSVQKEVILARMQTLSRGLSRTPSPALQERYQTMLQEPVFLETPGLTMGFVAAEYLERHGTNEAVKTLIEASRYNQIFTRHALQSAYTSLDKTDFYDQFSALPKPAGGLRNNREYIKVVSNFLIEKVGGSEFVYMPSAGNDEEDKESFFCLKSLNEQELAERIDDRWLAFGITYQQTKLVALLARSGHAEAEAILRAQLLKKPSLDEEESIRSVLGLQRVGIADLHEVLLTALEDKRLRSIYQVEVNLAQIMLSFSAPARERLAAISQKFRHRAANQLTYLLEQMDQGGDQS